MPGASMVARRNCANCVCDGRDKAGHYIPVSLACYIANCRIHEKQTHCGPVFGWILLGGVWRGRVAPRGPVDRARACADDGGGASGQFDWREDRREFAGGEKLGRSILSASSGAV